MTAGTRPLERIINETITITLVVDYWSLYPRSETCSNSYVGRRPCVPCKILSQYHTPINSLALTSRYNRADANAYFMLLLWNV